MQTENERTPSGHGLRSMTGYGCGKAEKGTRVAVVEIHSVNRRQLDVRLQLPRRLVLRETVFHDLVKKRLSRGHVTATIRFSSQDEDADGTGLTRTQMRTAVETLRANAAALGLRDDLCASHLLQLTPGSREGEGPESDPDAENAAVAAFMQALDALCAMRAAEGERLRCDLERRLTVLRGILDTIRARAPDVVVAYRETLQRRLAEAGHVTALEDEPFRRELLLFATRSDITEETTRLDSHFEQAHDFLGSREPVGRTLDFLVQEMSREINTLGAKASDAQISGAVVAFKTELDRFREQVQNVE